MEFKLQRQSNPDLTLSVYYVSNAPGSPLMVDNEQFLTGTHALLAWVEQEFGTEDDWSYEVKRITQSFAVEALDITQDPVVVTDAPVPNVTVSHTLTITFTTAAQRKEFEKTWV
jgi:hypothetical protein